MTRRWFLDFSPFRAPQPVGWKVGDHRRVAVCQFRDDANRFESAGHFNTPLPCLPVTQVGTVFHGQAYPLGVERQVHFCTLWALPVAQVKSICHFPKHVLMAKGTPAGTGWAACAGKLSPQG